MSKRLQGFVASLAIVLMVTGLALRAQQVPTASDEPNEVTEQQPPERGLRVDGDRTKGYATWMAHDQRQGRKSLTEGYKATAKWAADNFRNWGLKPAGQDGTYFQDVPIERGFTYQTGRPEIWIGNREFLLEDGDFALEPSSTPATQVKAEVVFVGYGIAAPDKGLDEYAGLEVEGKIVLALKGSPVEAPAPRLRFGPARDEEGPSEAWTEESSDRVKIQTAYDRGAAALLLLDAESSRNERNRDELELEFDRDFLVFTIQERIFRAIMKTDRQESVSGFEQRLAVMRWDIRNLQARSMPTGAQARLKGYDTVQKYSEDLENNVSQNVIAKLPGTDLELKSQYVIIGGHMDHLGLRDGLVHNGADDNASGTAVVLEVARVLAEANYQPKRTIIFCCWCGEELGLLGSNHYTDNPCDGVTMDRVVAYFNLDMVGLGDTIGAPGALNFPTVWEIIKRDQDEDVLAAVEPDTGGPGGSDHSGFITKGIEAMALMTRGGNGHPDYHRPEDDAEKLDPEILRKTGQFVLQGVMNLADETKVELIVEDRQVIYDALRLYVANINPELEDGDWRRIDLAGYSQDKLRWRIASVEERPEKSLQTGVADLRLFDGDMDLLLAASDALGIGRVDVTGCDGQWVCDGQLTEKGRYFIGMMEEHGIVVNLVSPAPQLLRDVLAAATRPFIVTGFYLLDPQTYDAINKKQVLLGVKFDPADVDGCVERLERVKTALGDTDNPVLVVTTTEGLEEAKQELYKRLIRKGWQPDEIGRDRRGRMRGRGARATGIAAGNLSALR
ncbi:MAG: M20/M25/M40 family metallo-hydrolase [Sedimentisphaerales bacterium]|nr:M20/M25/M40 family metallo-hydrolase [Sedimentisphaerales bacterium]